jgi:hypothetical protein
MKTLFVSYYSDIPPSTFYSESAKKLKQTIENLGGRIYIEQLPNLGSYAMNCLRKPKFIFECLNKFQEPVIWIDADSLVHSLPIEMDNLEVDVACVEKSNGCPESALIYFNNTEGSRSFINSWLIGCAVDVPELDHPVLKDLWYAQPKEKRKSLPDNICSIRTDSKVTIVMSKTDGKREHTQRVINRRKQEGKIL